MHAKWTRTGCMKSLLPIFVALLLFTAAQANATYHHFAGASKMAKGTRVEFQTGKMSAHQMLTVVENLKQSVNAKTSKEYKATLQLDEVAIQNALANPNNAGAQRDLQAAQLDLSIKQDQTQKALTVGGGADRAASLARQRSTAAAASRFFYLSRFTYHLSPSQRSSSATNEARQTGSASPLRIRVVYLRQRARGIGKSNPE
jgi:hypothetical protein